MLYCIIFFRVNFGQSEKLIKMNILKLHVYLNSSSVYALSSSWCMTATLVNTLLVLHSCTMQTLQVWYSPKGTLNTCTTYNMAGWLVSHPSTQAPNNLCRPLLYQSTTNPFTTLCQETDLFTTPYNVSVTTTWFTCDISQHVSVCEPCDRACGSVVRHWSLGRRHLLLCGGGGGGLVDIRTDLKMIFKSVISEM